jgi:hypothetical protein
MVDGTSCGGKPDPHPNLASKVKVIYFKEKKAKQRIKKKTPIINYAT